MEAGQLNTDPRTKKLLDSVYPSGYKIIHGHSFDSNCAGWLAYRLKGDVYKHDDELLDPRSLFDKTSPSWFQYLNEIDISGLDKNEIEKLKGKFSPLQILGLVTESKKLVHVLLYDPEGDKEMPYESKQQGGSFGVGNSPPTRSVSLYDQIINMEKAAYEKITHIEIYEIRDFNK